MLYAPYINRIILADDTPSWVDRTLEGVPALLTMDFANNRYWFGRGNPIFVGDHSGFLSFIGGTFTRASTATYWDSAGVLQTAASGALRFDHNPATKAAKGILLEGARTNSILQSRDFDTTWTAAVPPHTPVLTKDQTGIDGVANSAWTIDDNNASQYEGLVQAITVPNDSNTNTASIYILKDSDTSRFPEMQMLYTGGSAIDSKVQINTSTGATNIRSQTATTSVKVTDSGLWWRFEVHSDNNSSGNTTLTAVFYPAVTTSFGSVEVAAQGSCGADAFQVELNAAAASSFITTTTVAVTRAADSLVIGPTGSVPFTGWGATAGSLIVAGQLARVPAAAAGLASFHDNTANEVIELVADASANLDFDVVDGGAAQAAIDSTVNVVADTAFKLGAAWEANDFALSADGTAAQTDAAGTLPTVDRLAVGTDQAGNTLFGHINHLAYFQARITNAGLQALTN